MNLSSTRSRVAGRWGAYWAGTRSTVLASPRLASSVLLAVACVCAWSFCKPSLAVFPLDDAYIHLAYVRCLVQSGQFCFNPGEPSLGTSSPLYVLLLAPFYRAGLSPYGTSLAIGLVCSITTTLLTQAIARRAARESGVAGHAAEAAGFLAGLLVACNGALNWMAFSGMETPLLLAVSLAVVWSFARRGYDVVTGALAGVLFLVRAPGAVLALLLLFIELVGGRGRRSVAGAITSAVIALPMMAISYAITGGVFPTTAKGKLLTYVSGGYDFDEMLHFLGRFAELQKYTPVNYALFAMTVFAAGRWLVTSGKASAIRQLFVRRSLSLVVGLWGLAHFATYLWGFRTVGQQGRYLVEEQVVLAILGAVALLAMLARAPRQRLLAFGAAPLLLAVAVSVLPLWRGYLESNVEHIDATFLQMGRYIATSTPAEARIGAFDIGVARYVGDRYVIDLGGLLDPKSWPCLRLHDCGSYARAQGATYFLYSREPEADNITGIGRSEFGRPDILRQTSVYDTRYPDYAAPTLTHSLWLDLARVDGWYPRTDAGLRAAFLLDPGEAPAPQPAVDLGDGLELVGSSLDTDSIHYMRGYPYELTVTLDYRVRAQPTHATWLHIGLFYVDKNDAQHLERVATELHVLASEGVVLPGHWPVGDVVRIPQRVLVPYLAPGSRWTVRVAVSTSPYSDERYPQLETWNEVGTFRNEPSQMRPLAPL